MPGAVSDDRPLPSNRPYVTGAEADLVRDALEQASIEGIGSCGARSEALLEELLGADTRALLTPSCTAALEMAAMLIGTGAGSEVIVPSFTFVSTANAFARHGATPVFVDIDPETLTLDPAAVEAAITPTTAAVVPVHYAGGACRIDAILDIAQRHDLVVVEDAAHCIGASLDGRALGTIGALGTLSFHHTKNVSSGEGGALLINEQRWTERAEVLRASGTNRARFMRGEVDRYTWVDTGSSFVVSDVTAALLRGQLERLDEITEARLTIWDAYHAAFEGLERGGFLRRPRFVDGAAHNAPHLLRAARGRLAARRGHPHPARAADRRVVALRATARLTRRATTRSRAWRYAAHGERCRSPAAPPPVGGHDRGRRRRASRIGWSARSWPRHERYVGRCRTTRNRRYPRRSRSRPAPKRLSARSVEPWAEAGRAFQAGDPRFLTSGKLFGMQCSLLGRIGHGDGG